MRSHLPRLAATTLTVVALTACAGGPGTGSPVAAPSAVAPSTAPSADIVGDIDIGGRTLSVACLGPVDTGRPTVIFETGLGSDRFVWADVLTGLISTDRGCSYDRAGLGASEPGPKPRTTDDQVDDLRALLDAAGVKPPYVLVGHSSGGWNAMVFADRYPDDVAGAVFVDVRPPGTSQAFLEALPPETDGESDAIHQERAALTEWEHDPMGNPEGLDLIKSAAQAMAASGFGSRPLVVLTAGDRTGNGAGLPADLATRFDAIWMDLQGGLVELSSNGRHEIVAGATHDMPFEKPDVIVQAIRDVLQGAG